MGYTFFQFHLCSFLLTNFHSAMLIFLTLSLYFFILLSFPTSFATITLSLLVLLKSVFPSLSLLFSASHFLMYYSLPFNLFLEIKTTQRLQLDDRFLNLLLMQDSWSMNSQLNWISKIILLCSVELWLQLFWTSLTLIFCFCYFFNPL